MKPDLIGKSVMVRRALSLGDGKWIDAGSMVEIVGHCDAWFDVSGEYRDKDGNYKEAVTEAMDTDLDLADLEQEEGGWGYDSYDDRDEIERY